MGKYVGVPPGDFLQTILVKLDLGVPVQGAQLQNFESFEYPVMQLRSRESGHTFTD